MPDGPQIPNDNDLSKAPTWPLAKISPEHGAELGSNTKMYDVSMSSTKKVDIPKDDSDTYVVKTVGVNGCDSVLAWSTDPLRGDEILLTHYPPTEVDQHLQVLRNFQPSGDEKTVRVVYLTMGRDSSDWVVRTKQEIEESLGVVPEIVSLAGLPLESIKEMQHDSTLYQLIATKGYNGNPNSRRIVVPLPDRHAYELQF